MTRSASPSASPAAPARPAKRRSAAGARGALRAAEVPAVTSWTVTITVDLPAEGNFRLHETVVDRIRAHFRGYGPVIAEYGSQVSVVLGLDADDVSAVNATIGPLVGDVTTLLGVPRSAAGDLRIVRADADDALVGLVEAAEILAVSKQRVGQLSHRPDFPSPVARLRAGPVWRSEQIKAFDRGRARRRGAGTSA